MDNRWTLNLDLYSLPSVEGFYNDEVLRRTKSNVSLYWMPSDNQQTFPTDGMPNGYNMKIDEGSGPCGLHGGLDLRLNYVFQHPSTEQNNGYFFRKFQK